MNVPAVDAAESILRLVSCADCVFEDVMHYDSEVSGVVMLN